MMRMNLAVVALAATCLFVAVQPAGAQATRTWVSGVGNDADPCSRTAPCKTFAGAISKTAAGGEINALDPGGFGAVTITKSITIDGGGGQVASTLASGTNGIIINAGASDTVTLRNIRINGVVGTPVAAGLNGVRFLAGAALHVENCTIFGFSQIGIDVNVNTASGVSVFVTDSVLSHNATGIAAKNAGSGTVSVALQRTTVVQNSSIGFRADGSGGTAPINGAVSDSLVAGNGTGVQANGGPSGTGAVHVTRSSIVNNFTNGAVANASAGKPATVLFSNTLVTGNGTGVSSVGGGGLATYKNNAVNGNVTDGAFTVTITPE